MVTVMVTGGAGYIGSHAALRLLEAGHRVVIVDNLCTGFRELAPPAARFVKLDVSDAKALAAVFAEESIDAVMHFAAHAYVGESVTNPAKYYRNNVGGTMSLLDAMVDAGVKRLVFSSTCAVYGDSAAPPIDESRPMLPVNPYGATKAMVERILRDYDRAYGLKSVALRYFNAAGADPKGRSGERHEPETHAIPLVIDAALGRRPSFSIHGTDYPTPDGTCIRDYIHVTDLAAAHVAALGYLMSGGPSEACNLGNQSGFSVREVIASVERVAGRTVRVVEGPRREGDPPALIADAGRAHRVLGWRPAFGELDTIIAHALAWNQR